jgi:hypothetical protein
MNLAESTPAEQIKSSAPIDLDAPVFQRGQSALQLLYDSYCYAQQLDRSLWDFAEEIASLRSGGLTNGDLRWLICNGLVEHGHEITKIGEETRKFQRNVGLRFSKKTCFVLTDAAISCVAECLNRTAGSEKKTLLTPSWDRDLQELRVGRTIVKKFRVPAPNQEVILAVFQEEGWPVFIDDPLSSSDIDPKRRLHDTINSLNRNQQNHLIQFRGNGSGDGVRWELVNSSESSD